MTKKDYIVIAEALKIAVIETSQNVHTLLPHDIMAHIVSELAAAMKRDNPRFDEARFRAAVFSY